MSLALLVDFGSTFIKMLCLDLEREIIVARSQEVTTVTSNIMVGLERALTKLHSVNPRLGKDVGFSHKIACSSAAGGLRMVVVGLVPSLTLEAARQAALGAGAKIVGSYHHKLVTEDVSNIERHGCDLLLLTGGTDGGDEACILHNARALSTSRLEAPIIVAGNRVVSDEVRLILKSGGENPEVVENVLPSLDTLNVEPVRTVIREIFMKRIIRAKGLDEAQEFLGGNVVMPTPMAVLKGAELLARGTEKEAGMGELMVVDVGGATTDVHSVAAGHPTRAEVVVKGVSPAYAQRTVEGDLGIRYNADHILEEVGEEQIIHEMRHLCPSLKRSRNLKKRVEYLLNNVGFLPATEQDRLLDIVLAKMAVWLAVGRHVANLKPLFVPGGQIFVQEGKDLSNINSVIGVGGIFTAASEAAAILKSALYNEGEPLVLKPRSPHLLADRHYLLYAVGLLSTAVPLKALRIAKKYLEKIT